MSPGNSDELIGNSYQFLIDNCSEDTQKIINAENDYGNYYLSRKQSGLAISHIQRAVDLSKPNSVSRFVSEANLGNCYSDMGKFTLRDHYFSQAVSTGRHYFSNSPWQPTREFFNQVVKYCSILEARLGHLSRQRNDRSALEKMHRIWVELEAFIQKWYSISFQFKHYLKPISYFAAAGDVSFSKKLYQDIKALNRLYPYKNQEEAEVEFLKLEAIILEAEGHYNQATDLYKIWVDNYRRVTERDLPAEDLSVVGLALEKSGDCGGAVEFLSRSVEIFEQLRNSFEINSRTQVLSGQILESYWGLCRTAAKHYLATRNLNDFFSALLASRKLRARQFGELLGVNSNIESSLDQTQHQLAEKELLISIVTTNEAVIVFLVSKKSADLKVITIDSYRFNELLNRTRTNLASYAENDSLDNLLQLSKIIIEPIREVLQGYDKLTVIPDGLLTGIPFAALSKSPVSYSPLLLNWEISYTPSISYLTEQRRRPDKTYDDTILALADPLIQLQSQPEEHYTDSLALYKRAVDAFGLFTPLPETRKEIENIVSLFPPEKIMKLVGEEATKKRLLSCSLQDFRYLHFATHGVLGNQIPGIDEPAILLSAMHGQSFEDTFLTFSDVLDLKLEAELTVLSACDTGNGEYFSGEGVMGLSRSFLLAGSKTVIVSLWPIESNSTVVLMTDFYKNLRNGKTKSSSLRLAQMNLLKHQTGSMENERGLGIIPLKSKSESSMPPFFWAPFILIGD